VSPTSTAIGTAICRVVMRHHFPTKVLTGFRKVLTGFDEETAA
jgi:hypothetical protein